MPTAPLFYQPLVLARVKATPIGNTDVYAAHRAGLELTQKAYSNEQFKPRMDGIVAGFTKLQDELAGSTTLQVPQFAYDDNGYVANRVMTTMRLHPELFDTASPDQAAEIGVKLVAEAKKELATNPGMRAVGDTLEVAPDMTFLLQRHWEGKTIHDEDVAYLGVTAARELQRAVTPLPPDATSPLQWLEEGTVWTMALWPGAAAKTAAALGLAVNVPVVEKVVAGMRADMKRTEPTAEGPVASVTMLLGAAGITGTDDAARTGAYAVLQGTPLEGVPAGIAQAIVQAKKIPAERTEYVAKRIVGTGGDEGNVIGLIAELEQMMKPVPPPGPVPPPPPAPVPPPGPPAPVPPPGPVPPPT